MPPGYALRRFEPRDIDALVDLTIAAIVRIGPRRYSTEQVSAWAARLPRAEQFEKRAADAKITIAVTTDEKDDIPRAYALLERDTLSAGHLDMLYCHPDHTKRGLANALLKAVENDARLWPAPRLYTEASELARPAFERAGYEVQHRRDFSIAGVAIHNYAMEKRLG